MSDVTDLEYARLLALRTGLRHFDRWSAKQAEAAGLTAAHHQLLLAIRGHLDPQGPTIGEVADYLLLLHHSTVGLVDRAEAAGLVRRERCRDDHRLVRLRLTEEGARRLEVLSKLHLEELDRLSLKVDGTWAGLGPVQRLHGFPGSPEVTVATSRNRVKVGVARVYDEAQPGGTRVLVDRLWPRGIAKNAAPFEQWCKDVAPSTELRKWYSHLPERFAEFAERYRAELSQPPASAALAELRASARGGGVVLVTATKDLEHSGAVVVRDVLAGR